MNASTIGRWTHVMIAPVATLLFADMFLDWHDATVGVAGVVSVHGHASAWNGWGAIAGFATAGILLWSWLRVVGAAITNRLTDEVVIATLAAIALLFTLVELFAGSADVNVASTVLVSSTLRWPAYVAVALSAAIAAAAFVQLTASALDGSGRIHLTPS